MARALRVHHARRRIRSTTRASRPATCWYSAARPPDLPQAILDEFDDDRRLAIPMRPGVRSLNLSNAVAVAVYEAWRQQGFALPRRLAKTP